MSQLTKRANTLLEMNVTRIHSTAKQMESSLLRLVDEASLAQYGMGRTCTDSCKQRETGQGLRTRLKLAPKMGKHSLNK